MRSSRGGLTRCDGDGVVERGKINYRNLLFHNVVFVVCLAAMAYLKKRKETFMILASSIQLDEHNCSYSQYLIF